MKIVKSETKTYFREKWYLRIEFTDKTYKWFDMDENEEVEKQDISFLETNYQKELQK